MVINTVSKAAIVNAMQVFDTALRGLHGWKAWEQDQSYLYAIDVEGTLYPAKKMASLATGLPVSELSGGCQTNSYQEKHGFVVKELPRHVDPPTLQFQLGATYGRSTEMHSLFDGNYRNGISVSKNHPETFIFSGKPAASTNTRTSDMKISEAASQTCRSTQVKFKHMPPH